MENTLLNVSNLTVKSTVNGVTSTILNDVNMTVSKGEMVGLVGKTGSGKRINMEMKSSVYKFSLNIRDTQGKDGYPTRLMCDFSYL